MSADFSIHISCRNKPPSGILERIQKSDLDRKIVSIAGSIHGHKLLHKEIREGRIAKSEKQFKELSHSREWVPLSTRPIHSQEEAAQLTKEELVFIQIKELKIPARTERMLERIASEDQSLGLRVIQVQRQLELQWGIEAADEHQYNTLLEKLEIPVAPEVVARADRFLQRHPPQKITPEQRILLEAHRLGSSLTLRGDPRKMEEWRKADAFIQEKAMKKESFTLEDLCHLNALCIGEDEKEDLGGGEIRSEYASAGEGIDGVSYMPPQYVTEATTRFLEDLSSGIARCERGEQNPIVFAAVMAQRSVAIHPFVDANGRVAGFIADYVLERLGLPPAARGSDAIPAVFGEQRARDPLGERTPTTAVEVILNALERSYRILQTPEEKE